MQKKTTDRPTEGLDAQHAFHGGLTANAARITLT